MSKPAAKYAPVATKGPGGPVPPAKGAPPAGAKPNADDKRPPPTAIERMYEEILEETLTPPDVRKRLVDSQSIDQKWMFIQVHKHSGDKLVAWGEKEQSLLRTIHQSMNPDIITVLNLKVLLSSANRDFMAGFVAAGGVNTLTVVILKTVNKKPYTTVVVAFLYEVLLCCKLVMNNAIGMKGFQEAPGALDSIALCLSFDYKPLAMLVLEILSATCYCEESTKEVVDSLERMCRKLREPAFGPISNALLTQDIEVKTAIMQLVISIILGADMDTATRLRKDLSNVFFEHTCEQAFAQVNNELSTVEEQQTVATPLLNYQKALSRSILPVSQLHKKVVNVDKLEGDLVAFKGIRQSVIRGNVQRAHSSHVPVDVANRAKAREDLVAVATHSGPMMIAALQPGCFGATSVLETRQFELDGEFLLRYITPDNVDKRINMQDVKDIRRNISDPLLIKLAHKNHLPVMDIVTSTEFLSVACSTNEEMESWLVAIQAARDQVVISKSSFYMHRTYLDLKDALAVAERFKKLFEQYSMLTKEEKQFQQLDYGFDLNDAGEVFSFLSHEVTAAGHYTKLLNVLQELLLVPSAAEGMWDAVIAGLRNLRRIQTRNSEANVSSANITTLDSAFSDLSIVDMLAKKTEEEGDGYKQMTKLALSHMTMKQENSELKDRVLELERVKSELDALLSQAGSEEKKQLLESEEEIGRLKLAVEQNTTTKELDDNQIKILQGRCAGIEEKLEAMRKENVELQKSLNAAEAKLAQQPQVVYVAAQTGAAALAAVASPAPQKFEKFEKMRKMLPEGAVRQKMSMEGLTEADIESFFSGAYLSQPTVASVTAAATAPVVDERYAKFEKMKKMLPEGAVRQKMAMDGFTEVEIEAFLTGKPSPAPAAAPAPPAVDERYAKFDKMKKMLPEGAVRQKMAMDGFTEAEIEAFMAGKPPPGAGAVDEKAEKKAKYEKMKKMLPEGAVRQKMAMDGFSPQEIDVFFGVTPAPGAAGVAAVPLPPLSPPQAIKFSKYDKMKKKGSTLDEIVKKMEEDEVSEDDRKVFLAHLQHQPAPTAPKKVIAVIEDANSPKVKLKNIFWTKIGPSDLKGTVWAAVAEHKLTEKHRGLIEVWFAAKGSGADSGGRRASLPGGVGAGLGMGSGSGSSAPSPTAAAAAPKAVSVLDGKRTQNVLIIMGKLRKSPEEVQRIIWELDPAVMTGELTNMMISIVPNAEEEKAVSGFTDASCATLDQASKLFYFLTRIPRLPQRLECHEVAFHWVNTAQEFTSQMKIYQSAIEELRKSQASMNVLFAIIISVGNYLNAGTKFGQAQGIKLDTLMKLPTMKASEASQGSLLNLIALVAEEYNKGWLSFTDDWVAVWAAADLNYRQLIGDINSLENVFNKLQAELTVLKENKLALGIGRTMLDAKAVKSNPLYKRLDGFLTAAKLKLQDLKNNVTKVEQGVEGVMASYGESVKDAEEDAVKRFFTVVVTFVRNLRKAHEDNTRRRLAAEKAAKAAEAKAVKSRASSLPPVLPAHMLPPAYSARKGPQDNIFGRFHSMQNEDSQDVLALYRAKLSGRQASVKIGRAVLQLEAEEQE